MEKIKIDFDPENNTLIIWFDEPEQMAYLSPIDEETPGDWHLIKQEDDTVIGLECQLYHIPSGSLELEAYQRNGKESTKNSIVDEIVDESDWKHMSLAAFERD